MDGFPPQNQGNDLQHLGENRGLHGLAWFSNTFNSRVPLAAGLFGHVSKCVVQDGLHGKAWGEWNP